MQPAPLPPDEPFRLSALQALAILDTPPEERFDRLTRLARRLFNVKIAAINLIDADRQWTKSAQGMPTGSLPREVSFCAHAILKPDILLVEDTHLDPRFADNPLVTGEPYLRFYAGAPLTVGNGARLGTLCLADDRPRQLSGEDLQLLRDLAAMAEQELMAAQLATMCDLTLLSNRRGFMTLANHSLHLCQRLKTRAMLLFFDLDHFKQINDTYGHAVGDQALLEFAQALKSTFRSSDVIGRLGGDEFVVLLTNTDPNQIDQVIQRLEDEITQLNREHEFKIQFSLGMTLFDPQIHSGIEDLLNESDKQMYQQKRSKRNRILNPLPPTPAPPPPSADGVSPGLASATPVPGADPEGT